MDFTRYFPYPEIRDVQRELLDELGKQWDRYDVFVIQAPTALGKSAVACAVAQGATSSSIITPTNQLVKQFLREFPIIRTLMTSFHYPQTPEGQGQYRRDLAQAIYRKQPGIYTYWMYYARKLHRDVLIADEAHGLVSMLQDVDGQQIWHHKLGIPEGITQDMVRFRTWLEKQKQTHGRKKWWKYAWAAITSPVPQHVITEGLEEWSGGGIDDEYGDMIKRGTATLMPCIRMKPVDVRDLPAVHNLLPTSSKIVLMSATIGAKDIEQLGLDRRRVVYIRCSHPIPAERRPVWVLPVVSVSRDNQEEATRHILEYVQRELLPVHKGEKGLLHVTYQQAEQMRAMNPDRRLLFHNSDNKMQIFQEFINSPTSQGRVLVASGMYEGVDLPYDLARWQAICKIPWASLGDAAVRHKADKDPEWYDWETWKKVIQACGRVCRTEKDYGVTFVLDGSFQTLYDRSSHLLPAWFKETLQWPTVS